jgi:hypothetical protein
MTAIGSEDVAKLSAKLRPRSLIWLSKPAIPLSTHDRP